MPVKEIIITGPNVEIWENGEDETRSLTCVVEANDGPRLLKIVFPEMTPAQLLCWGETMVIAAGLSVDERAKLSASSKYRVTIKEDV